MPVLRPRMVGIQSQPIEAWYVGLSRPNAPPFESGLCQFFSFTLPGVAFLMMRTASAFFPPARTWAVMSNRPRMNPPSMRPSFSPFR